MSLTVREALTLNVLRGAQVVAGFGGLDNPIRWTHIIEHCDVADWVKGGEVLMTSGLGFYDDPRAQEKYMREAAERRVAAVFVAMHDRLPQTTPAMRQIADRNDLPLVEVPYSVAFVEVTEAILRRLAARAPDAEREYLFDALLAGNLPESEETLTRLREAGVEPEHRHALALAQFADADARQTLSDEETRALVAALNRAPRRAITVARTNWVAAIFPLTARDTSSVPLARTLDGLLRAQGGRRLRLGVGRLAWRPADFPVSFREAREALFIASITDGGKAAWHFQELGVWRLLLRVGDDELRRFVDFYLDAVIGHDREQQTDWLRTLDTFLAENGNLRATARALGLHRNTVAYQLEHVGHLLGQDLDNAEVRLNLQVAMRARRLLAARNHHKARQGA